MGVAAFLSIFGNRSPRHLSDFANLTPPQPAQPKAQPPKQRRTTTRRLFGAKKEENG
jgi:hypothetical protein